MNVNKVFLGGRLTRDPEVKYTTSGTAICEFGVAVNRTWKDKVTGITKEETCFVDCTAWGKTGETMGKHLRKGREVFVEGRLKFDQWEDRTTHAKRSKLTVTVDSFQFVGGREEGRGPPLTTERRGSPPARAANADVGRGLGIPPGPANGEPLPPTARHANADHLPPQDTGPTPF